MMRDCVSSTWKVSIIYFIDFSGGSICSAGEKVEVYLQQVIIDSRKQSCR